MSESDGLLARITSLRERLERAQTVLREAIDSSPTATDLAEDLEREVFAGARIQSLLDGSLRQIAGALEGDEAIHPKVLTGRVRELLERSRQQLYQLRRLADDAALAPDDADDPLVQGVRRASAMVEASLRFVQAFPDAPSSQLRLAEGMEGLTVSVSERIAALTVAVNQRRTDQDQIATLAHWLTAVHEGRPVAPDPFKKLAHAVLAEASAGAPLRFLTAGSPAAANWLARHVAAHGLTVARVLARLVTTEVDPAVNPETAVLGALVHDIGLLEVSPDIIAQPGSPLSDADRRLIERHAQVGRDQLERLFGNQPGLLDAVAAHHERLDGSGYPGGLVGTAIPPGARLLAVADVYAALGTPRPYRPAADPRTALTDTLMQAERGALDRAAAERLLQFTFYPIGTVVELSDGTIARVVAVHTLQTDVHASARPVVQLLTDSRGSALAITETLDLNECPGRAVVRAVPNAQRRRILTARYPEWAA